ncbi:ATPase [Mesorhizobium sp. L-8-10]|uniref:sensor histidine kinase n=1 Tax=Mesorhizobium sp. L-8-10 TaxID=2744523 RepID=UPI0019253EFF|nr:HAMP domain-containing sensor histidine kinase [Mesorhizobium sp. L-8-10]BCH29930.1 ATPase [Mesorhizobium sp. L-8-10]
MLFLASFLVANIFAYNMVAAYLYERLDSHVTERFREIEAAYDARGIDGAVAMIGNHGPAIRGQETVYALTSDNGARLAGNVEAPSVPRGFSTLPPPSEPAMPSSYRLLRRNLGDFDLIVGVSYDDTDRLREIALVSFGWATAIVLASGLGGGALLAFRTRRRIAALSVRAKAVGAGELATRLPISRRRDDLDMLAAEINVALAQLESSVNAMRQVTTDIAHDPKTPISRLYLLLEQARDAATGGADVASILDHALDEVALITDTFEALLRISQIEAGARKGKISRIDLCSLMDELHEIYTPIIEDSGRSLRLPKTDRSQGLDVTGDFELLRQMCANILDNAIRHTDKGAVVTMGCGIAGGRCVIAIADDGPGIPEAERAKVFKRFYRLEKSRTTDGSGLGLSLVKAVADFHGAQIVLDDNHPGLVVRILFTSGQ